jgi:predicted amino acid dehydrogenase
VLIGRQQETLQQVKQLVEAQGQHNVRLSLDVQDLRQADLVLTVTNAIDTIIESNHLKAGCVVCDVARPRDVSQQVLAERNDILVIEGGMIRIPGPVNFNFDFGFPPGMAFACMAETIALALEGRFESYTLGKAISLSQVQMMMEITQRHGFAVSGYRRFEQAVNTETVAARVTG